MVRSTSSPKPVPIKRSGLLHGLFALRHSRNGIVATWREESAFRQEVCVAAVLLPIVPFVPVSAAEHVLLAASVLLVLLVELINSSIEAAIDRISLERHELSGRAKDCGSAAVTVSIVIGALAWGVICGPLAWRWLSAHF
ncbi:diacylglycerol kinase [Burkholderia sp. THE68]|uniref:diacylglycerol kinase n=1 Tax=Burkholderia sp. THE68 TaxID=758782 RepID=UPI001389D444|nr:diacylglycerol kinase [Burkholderia sp. THE68]